MTAVATCRLTTVPGRNLVGAPDVNSHSLWAWVDEPSGRGEIP